MDMLHCYAKGVREHFPRAQIVYDRFHLMVMAGEAVDEVRRSLQRQGANLKGPCGPCAAILGTWNPMNWKLAPAWPASTNRWVEPWRFGPHCKMSMKLPVGKDPNSSSVGADGQADLDWRPLKNWLKPFGSTGTELLVTSNVASLKVPSKPLTESSS